jgi:glycosyltransferase involved in cell wall biosynthesis
VGEPVAVLIATHEREDLLRTVSLPSVLRQTHCPEVLVVVCDGRPPGRTTLGALVDGARAAGVRLDVLQNARAAGAAGAWNTGLRHLETAGHCGYVALLDDDDAWDDDHLETNLTWAQGAAIVVSGLRMRAGGRVEPRPILDALDARQFLTGNPGWQGSNTFVSLGLLLAVGGFRDGLASLNDRDLAIRLLRHPDATWRLTGRWTATWNRDTPGSLSAPLSVAKREGLRRFWRVYGDEMTTAERSAFFARAESLFGIRSGEILDADDGAVGLEPPYGSLRE